MKKLNDIYTNLEEDVTLPSSSKEVKPEYTLQFNILESFSAKKKNILLIGQKAIKVFKNNSPFFDALQPLKKNASILDLSQKLSLYSKIQLFFSQLFQSKKRHIFTSLPLKKKKKKGDYFSQDFQKTFVFIAMSFFLLIFYYIISKPFIEYTVNAGFKKIITFKEESSAPLKPQVFSAFRDFNLAGWLFIPFRILPSDQVQTGYAVIQSGKYLSQSILDGIEFYDSLEDFVQEKGLSEIRFSQLFLNSRTYITTLSKDISLTYEYLKSIGDVGDPEIQRKIQEQIEIIGFVKNIFSTIETHFDTFLSILGHTKEKKYLIIFQNSDEIRPLGGFMGSTALVTLSKGQVQDLSMHDIYDLEWNIKKSQDKKVLAPEGINQLTPYLGLRDSNYFINVDDSSNTIREFSKKAGYPIDGIVYVNQNVILDILDTLNGVTSEKIGMTLTKDNFSEIISLLVESKKFKQGTLSTPKQALFDFSSDFIEAIQTKKQYSLYLRTLLEHTMKRDIIFYSFIPEENALLQELSLNGKIDTKKTLDFAYPVFTSLSGNKSDRYIERAYEKSITSSENCSYKTDFSVVLKHTFSQRNLTEITSLMSKLGIVSSDKLLYIQGRGENKQYVRILIPKEAQIQEKEGLFIEEYQGKKSVNFYMKTEAKQVTRFQFSYILQNKECLPYNFTLYKQAGIKDYDIQVNSLFEKDIINDFLFTK